LLVMRPLSSQLEFHLVVATETPWFWMVVQHIKMLLNNPTDTGGITNNEHYNDSKQACVVTNKL
jgi:hypothetical protein